MENESHVSDFIVADVPLRVVVDLDGVEIFIRDAETGDLTCGNAFIGWGEIDATRHRFGYVLSARVCS